MSEPNKNVHLSGLQLAVMRVLWAQREASTTEVAAALAPNRDLAHTTVATLLTRLERRGVVAQRRDGRVLMYRPLITEPEVRRSMVAEMVATLFRGDPGALVSHLVHESEIDAGDLERVRAMLADKAADHG
jgi:predicted transcriptional regulator